MSSTQTDWTAIFGMDPALIMKNGQWVSATWYALASPGQIWNPDIYYFQGQYYDLYAYAQATLPVPPVPPAPLVSVTYGDGSTGPAIYPPALTVTYGDCSVGTATIVPQALAGNYWKMPGGYYAPILYDTGQGDKMPAEASYNGQRINVTCYGPATIAQTNTAFPLNRVYVQPPGFVWGEPLNPQVLPPQVATPA